MPFPNVETQFKSGNNANPKGRPGGAMTSAKLRALASKETSEGNTIADVIASIVIKGALEGDPIFLKLYFDRTEGKAYQSIEVTGAGVLPLYNSARQQEGFANPRILELQCELDALLADESLDLDARRARDTREPWPMEDASSPGDAQ